jgi:hypothetical protein
VMVDVDSPPCSTDLPNTNIRNQYQKPIINIRNQ